MARPLLLAVVWTLTAGCRGCSPPSDLTITTESLPPGNVDATCAAVIATAGGEAPVTFDVASGALPLGVELDAATGALGGSPTEHGIFQFGVRATDSAGAVAVKGLSIEVFPYPPVRIVTTEVRNAVVGGTYLAILSAVDGSPPYTWSLASGTLPQGIRLTEGGSLVGSAAVLESQTFEVSASDSRQQARARFSITTFLPVTVAPAGPGLPDAYAGEPYSVTFAASGGLAPYSFAPAQAGGLPAWLTLTPAGALSGTPPAAAPHPISLRVQDSSRTDQVVIRDYALEVLDLPAFVTTAFPDTVVGQAYSAPVDVSGGRAPLAVRVSAGALPGGLALAGSAISGSPAAAGTFDFTLEVSDANARLATRDFRITVTDNLAITTGTLPDAYQGLTYGAALSAMGGTPPYSWVVVQGGLPAGIQLSTAGALSGSSAAPPGPSPFTVQATDSLGRTAQKALTLDLLARPALVGGALADGYAGEPYSVTLAATGGRAPFTYALGGGALPDGVSLGAAGTLSGVPTIPQGRSFTVTATDRNGQAASASFTVGIYAPVAVPPITLPDGYLTRTYSAQLASTGGKAPVQWSVASGALPGGIGLSSTGAISGTPTAAGSFAFDVQATDANGRSATRTLSIDVYPRPALAGGALDDGYVAEAYSTSIAATGGRPPLTYSVSAGSLPAGLALGGGGLLSGSPSAAGSFSFTITAVDANGQTAAAPYTLAVHALPLIATTSLPDAVTGEAYSADLLSTGGKPALGWTVPPGALPPGLSLTTATGSVATLSGTPTAPGFYAFTATLTDANGRMDAQDLSILVTVPPPPPDAGSDGGVDGGVDGGADGGTDGGTDAGLDGRFFRLANWNVEWFGDPGNGPTNEAVQQANVRAIMSDAGYEIWALQEVVSVPAFNALVAGLPGYEGIIASDSSRVAGTSSCGSGSSLCYFNGEQQLAVVYRADVVSPVSARLILTTTEHSFAGRPPLRVDFVLDGGAGERLTVITLHMKAQADPEDWERRRDAGGLMESYLRANFDGGSRVAVIGDWNDDVDVSIVNGQPTPYANFNADPVSFAFLTAPLSDAGIRSTVSNPGFIDHQLAMRGLFPWYVPGSAQRVPFTTWIPGAGTSTSDHYPIVSRFNLGGTSP
jgi:hypothetical protein